MHWQPEQLPKARPCWQHISLQDAKRRQGVFERGQLERSAVITLVIIAIYPLWEVIRDLRRLRQL